MFCLKYLRHQGVNLCLALTLKLSNKPGVTSGSISTQITNPMLMKYYLYLQIKVVRSSLTEKQ